MLTLQNNCYHFELFPQLSSKVQFSPTSENHHSCGTELLQLDKAIFMLPCDFCMQRLKDPS